MITSMRILSMTLRKLCDDNVDDDDKNDNGDDDDDDDDKNDDYDGDTDPQEACPG